MGMHRNLLTPDTTSTRVLIMSSYQASSRTPPPSSSEEVFSTLPQDISLQILSLLPRSSWPTLRCVSTAWEAALNSQDILDTRKLTNVVEDFVYVVAKSMGRQKLLVLNPAESRWYTLGNLPVAACGVSAAGVKDYPLDGFGLVSVGSSLVLLGGHQFYPPTCMELSPEASSEGAYVSKPSGTWLYSAQRNSWQKGANMLAGSRSHFASGNVGGKVYAAGGLSVSGEHLSSAEVYDPLSDSWQSLPPLPAAEESHTGRCTGAVVGGRFYVFGVNLGGFLLVRGVFDPISDSWEVPQESPDSQPLSEQGFSSRGIPGVQAVEAGGKIYFMRGLPDDTPGWGDRMLRCYEPASNSWRVVSRFPSLPGLAREWEVTRQAFSLAAVKGEVYVVGGVAWARLFGREEVQSAQVFDPSLAASEDKAWRSVGHYDEELFLGTVWKCACVSL